MATINSVCVSRLPFLSSIVIYFLPAARASEIELASSSERSKA